MNTKPTVAETHISTLFFTTDRVFKILKPVANGFLDHTAPEDRCSAAEREVELNRRICPDVYLGTADVFEHGRLTDRMIVMERLPADRSVSALLAAGALTQDHIREIARKVATFHASLPPEAHPRDVVETHRQRWAENMLEMAEFVGPVLDPAEVSRVGELYSAWLDAHRGLLEDRVRSGYLRDGHGDLLADDIFCMDSGPKILDCLAFRDDLRRVDVLDDIAFLAMDLHRLGGASWAQLLLRYYREFSAERHPGSLAHYYLAYRAHVRCKVACLRVAAGDAEFGATARLYHRLCLDQLERARLQVILVGGGPGTGKTTLANALAEQLGCPVLSSDEIRKDLAHQSRTDHYDAEIDAGIYTDDFTLKTYGELLREAGLLLRSGSTVVLDASWTRAEHRRLAVELASDHRAELIELECQLPLSVAKERIVRRFADPLSVSDATPAIAEHLHSARDPWPDAIGIDCNQCFAAVEAEALAALEALGKTSVVDQDALYGNSVWTTG